MTENIFENGGEFCLRGDSSHKPVEWHWFKTPADQPVVYFDGTSIRKCRLDGHWAIDDFPAPHKNDLIPIPSPPQIVPWESPDDVPDWIWIRQKDTVSVFAITAFGTAALIAGGTWIYWHDLFDLYEYHTDRRAKDGWQPCGKVVKS